jgi:hypothetical protein
MKDPRKVGDPSLCIAEKANEWGDPQAPTVQGIVRRCTTIPALQDFIPKQSPSRDIVSMVWSILEQQHKGN